MGWNRNVFGGGRGRDTGTERTPGRRTRYAALASGIALGSVLTVAALPPAAALTYSTSWSGTFSYVDVTTESAHNGFGTQIASAMNRVRHDWVLHADGTATGTVTYEYHEAHPDVALPCGNGSYGLDYVSQTLPTVATHHYTVTDSGVTAPSNHKIEIGDPETVSPFSGNYFNTCFGPAAAPDASIGVGGAPDLLDMVDFTAAPGSASLVDSVTTHSECAPPEACSYTWDTTAHDRTYTWSIARNVAPPGFVVTSPKDALLKHSLLLHPEDFGLAAGTARSYQYGWTSDLSGATTPTKLQTCRATAGKCTLSYLLTDPDEDWLLKLRAVDTSGAPTAWQDLIIHTPTAPVLIALGDSVVAGFHADPSPTVSCDDAYSYAQTAYTRMQAKLPVAWRSGPYVNLAISGSRTSDVLGTSAAGICGSAGVPINDAVALLASRQSSWNRVVVTAGANDTNWQTLVSTILAHQSNPGYSAGSCANDIATTWTLQKGNALAATITNNVKQIVQAISVGDPAARVAWTSYYNIAGTGPMTTVCAVPVDSAVKLWSDTINRGLKASGVPYKFVNINKVVGLNGALVQGSPGWPHPNSAGMTAIGNKVPL